MSRLALDMKDRKVTGGTHSWLVALPFDLKTKHLAPRPSRVSTQKSDARSLPAESALPAAGAAGDLLVAGFRQMGHRQQQVLAGGTAG